MISYKKVPGKKSSYDEKNLCKKVPGKNGLGKKLGNKNFGKKS